MSSDQKPWWKFWFYKITDPKILSLPPEERWCWATLSCYANVHGKDGSVEIDPNDKFLAVAFGCQPQQVLGIIKRLPHIHIEESENCHTKISLHVDDWRKDQGEPREEPHHGFVRAGGKWKPEAEHTFSGILKELGIEFREQHRFPHGKTFYTTDFFLPQHHLAFEIQGPEHATKKYRELDQRKKQTLMADFGVVVKYVDNTSILQNLDFVRRYVIEVTSSSPIEEKRREEKRREEKRTTTPLPPSGDRVPDPVPSASSAPAEFTMAELIALWNSQAPKLGLGTMLKLTNKRKAKIQSRLLSYPQREFWKNLILVAIPNSPFLIGENNNGWKVSLEWLMTNDENPLKVAEGRYANRKETAGEKTARNLFQAGLG